MHQSLQGATFHVEHVIPSSHSGQETLLNLVLACPSCNLHKSNRVEALDPETGEVVPLFHPLADVWNDNFSFVDFEIVGKTACGRATLEALRAVLRSLLTKRRKGWELEKELPKAVEILSRDLFPDSTVPSHLLVSTSALKAPRSRKKSLLFLNQLISKKRSNFNHPRRLKVREAEALFELFPPE